MKSIYKLFLIPILLVMASSCSHFELDLTENPNSVPPEQADINFFLNQVQLEYGTFIQQTSDVGAQIARQRAMTGGNTYNNAWGPNDFDGWWSRAYASLLPDIEAITAIATERGLFTQLGIVQTMKAHVLMVMVDMFGDIPYSEALQGTDIIGPKADSGASVYAAALALLDEAIKNLGETSAPVTNDYYYDGSTSAWSKAAHTLKLRYFLNTRLVDSGTAMTEINNLIASGNLITAAADDLQAQYGTTRQNPDSRHPWYVAQYETGNGPYQSNYYMWSLLAEKEDLGTGWTGPDPRLRYYFYRQDCDANGEDQFTLQCPTAPRPAHYTGPYPWCVASMDLGYWGRDHGNNDGIPPDGQKRTVYGLYPAGGSFDADDCVHVKNAGADGGKGGGITPIMLSSYTHFMLAEAALTLGTDGDPRQYMLDGIQHSMDKTASFSSISEVDPAFEITQTWVDDYLAFVGGQYDAAASDDDRLGVIIKEYHLASWGSGEAFNAYRRTGHPQDMQPTRDLVFGDFAYSMWYPSAYVDQNANASQKGNPSVKVFWDTNNFNLH